MVESSNESLTKSTAVADEFSSVILIVELFKKLARARLTEYLSYSKFNLRLAVVEHHGAVRQTGLLDPEQGLLLHDSALQPLGFWLLNLFSVGAF